VYDFICKGKLPLSLTNYHAMKTYGGGEIWLPVLEMSGQVHVPASLPPKKEPPYPFNSLDGTQSRSGRMAYRENP